MTCTCASAPRQVEPRQSRSRGAVPGPGEGDGECARRAAHVEDLITRLEREQIEEPALVLAGREPGERRGPLVPMARESRLIVLSCVDMGWSFDAPTVKSLTRGLARIMSCKRRPCRERN